MNNIKKGLLGFVLVATLVVVGPVSQSSADILTIGELIPFINSFYDELSKLELSNAPADKINELLSRIKVYEENLREAQALWSSDGSDFDDFSYTWKTDLRLRMSSNNDVRALQAALFIEGFYKGKIDGNFGRNTRLAVIKFQKKYSLKKNGIVGKAMREELNDLYGSDDGEPSDNGTVTPTPTTTITPTPPITTTPHPYITVTSPNGEESLVRGQTYTIRWQSAGLKGNVHISATKIDDNYGTANKVVPASLGQYSWSIESYLLPGSYKINVSSFHEENGLGYDISALSEPFSVVAAETGTPSITVTSPNGGESLKRGDRSINIFSPSGSQSGGEKWPLGSTQTIGWKFNTTDIGPYTNIYLYSSSNVELGYITKLSRSSQQREFNWSVGSFFLSKDSSSQIMPTGSYKIKVVNHFGEGEKLIEDSSPLFNIVAGTTIPTIIPITISLPIAFDNEVNSLKSSEVISKSPYINIGYSSTYGSEQMYYLGKIDLNSFDKTRNIQKAMLRIDRASNSHDNTRDYVIYPLKSEFNPSTVTWKNQPSIITDRRITGTLEKFGVFTFDITNMANGWISGLIPNYGLMITKDEGAGDGYGLFASIDYPSGGAETKPSLEITYTEK